MEQYVYTVLSGASHTMTAQRVHANNLANIDTTGFRADMENQASYQVPGPGFGSNIMAQDTPTLSNYTPGMLEDTGRDLDVGIHGPGLLTVLDANGREAYTRAGNMQVNSEGQLLIGNRVVVGVNGPIEVPEYRSISIGADGTVSVVPVGGNAMAEAGQLKRVNPEIASLAKGEDGLFRLTNGAIANVDENVKLESEHLEMSNVNAVDEMVNTLQLSRTFEIQVKMMKTADELGAAGSRLIRGS